MTVKKFKPFSNFEKNLPNDENLPQKLLFESSARRPEKHALDRSSMGVYLVLFFWPYTAWWGPS